MAEKTEKKYVITNHRSGSGQLPELGNVALCLCENECGAVFCLTRNGERKTAKPAAKEKAKAEVKAEAKPEVKAEVKAEAKPVAKTTKAAAKTTKTAKKAK